jgi:hypothetical protein
MRLKCSQKSGAHRFVHYKYTYKRIVTHPQVRTFLKLYNVLRIEIAKKLEAESLAGQHKTSSSRETVWLFNAPLPVEKLVPSLIANPVVRSQLCRRISSCCHMRPLFLRYLPRCLHVRNLLRAVLSRYNIPACHPDCTSLRALNAWSTISDHRPQYQLSSMCDAYHDQSTSYFKSLYDKRSFSSY